MTSKSVAALQERLTRGKRLVVLGRCVLEKELVARLDGSQRNKCELVAARRRRAIADGGGGHRGGDDGDVADAGVIKVASE
jgi:hypothetical protein